jgi:GTP-binding protein
MLIINSSFVSSASEHNGCPKPVYPEFAFLGRSNVGKSSLINMILGRKDLARTSSTPGKTQLINHFLVNEQWYLVDLPGLGYAKVSKGKKRAFRKMITTYLTKRKNLLNVFFLIDVRHEPQAIDLDFIDWMGSKHIPFTLVFTKSDKVTQIIVTRNVKLFTEKLSETWEEMPMMVESSSKTKIGRDKILGIIEASIPVFDKNRILPVKNQ